MRKKYKIALITIIILILGFWGIKEYTSDTLPRDSDTEFQKGSKIKKQNLYNFQYPDLVFILLKENKHNDVVYSRM